MNPNDVLDGLSNGLATCNVNTPLDPSVIAAIANASVQQKAVTRIGTPAVAKTVDLGTLSGGTQNQTEFTFTNNTAQTIVYWFTSLFANPGQPFNRSINNSAVDFPAAQGTGQTLEGGGGDLANFNAFILANGGAIIGKIEVESVATGSQKTQQLIVRTDNITDQPCSANRFAPFCDSCYNNNGSDTFVATFKCPLGVGGGSSFGYPVLAGQSVTFRITSIATAINQFAALPGGDCGC